MFCVRMYTEVPALSEARRVRSSGAGVIYGCESPDMDAEY